MKLRNPKQILLNPDRPNIMLSVEKRPASEHTKDHLDTLLYDMVSSLKEKPKEFPVTIMYTDTATISYCYWYMDKALNESQYIGECIPENRIFGQYHSEYTDSMKKVIVTELCKKNSTIRLVFATVSLGMGLNAPGIRHVIHYKPPTSVEKYFQEIGRAGRDGLPSKATLYYNNTDIRTNRPGITHDIITYCRQEQQCRRKVLLDYFGYDLTPENPDSLPCCDVCEHKD